MTARGGVEKVSTTWTSDGTLPGGGGGGAVSSVNGQTGTVVLDTDDIAEGANLYYTTERAQDDVGGILDDSGDVDFTYDDATPKITAVVKSNAVTYAKMQDVSATSRVLGRISSGSGDVEELTGANLKTVIDTVTVGFSVNLGDGTNVITSSEPYVIVRIPYALTVTRWDLQSDVSGSITLEVDRAAEGTPNTFSSVAGSEKPALSSAQSASDTTPFSGGDTTWDEGDRIKVYVSGTPSSIKRASLHITGTRVL